MVVVIPAQAGISQPRGGRGRGSCLRRNDGDRLPALHGRLHRLAADERVVERVGELCEDGRGVERVVLAVVERVLLDVLRRDHAAPSAVLAGEVGGVERGDGDAVVEVALGVMRVVELTVAGERVADEQQALRLQPLDGVDVRLRHRVRLGHDDEQLRRVEALDVERVVGREAEREPLLVDAVRVREHPAAEHVGGGSVRLAHLVPDDLFDLALRRAEGEGLALRARLQPPEHGAPGGPVLAGAVRADDADAPLVHECLEHLGLLRVRRPGVAEHVGHEADGVVRVWSEILCHGYHTSPTRLTQKAPSCSSLRGQRSSCGSSARVYVRSTSALYHRAARASYRARGGCHSGINRDGEEATLTRRAARADLSQRARWSSRPRDFSTPLEMTAPTPRTTGTPSPVALPRPDLSQRAR